MVGNVHMTMAAISGKRGSGLIGGTLERNGEMNMIEDIKSPVKAIHAFCVDCMGGSAYEVRGCNSYNCVLHPFRFGKNPFIKREMTDEQKEAAKIRLADARRRKGQNNDD